jgi:hypothetical protein
MVVPRVLGLVTRAPAPVNELSAARKKKAKKFDLGSTGQNEEKVQEDGHAKIEILYRIAA